jgi:ubiquinone/menaquinone biosynthesis C-methylase UbiE
MREHGTDMTTPGNPFAAADAGAVYARGRPFHHPRSLARIRALVGDEPLGTALDVACGTGMSTVALAEHALHAIGLDASAEMLQAARRDAPVSYLLGNAERLPFPPGTIDAVTCCSGVHWFDQTKFFAELHRVLRPQGWVGLYDHYFVGEMIDVPEFKDWCRMLLDTYPLPPRNPQVGDPSATTPAGFVKVADDFFGDDIEFTQDAFADYQLTISNFVTAVERGTPRAELRGWLLETTAPLWAGATTRTLRFLGSITALRRIP